MNILVTGASAGIGKCIANSLEGEIFAVGRCKERLQQYKNYLVCDFEKSPDELGEYIISNKIDIVINNAGEYIYKAADKLELADIERLNLYRLSKKGNRVPMLNNDAVKLV